METAPPAAKAIEMAAAERLSGNSVMASTKDMCIFPPSFPFSFFGAAVELIAGALRRGSDPRDDPKVGHYEARECNGKRNRIMAIRQD